MRQCNANMRRENKSSQKVNSQLTTQEEISGKGEQHVSYEISAPGRENQTRKAASESWQYPHPQFGSTLLVND